MIAVKEGTNFLFTLQLRHKGSSSSNGGGATSASTPIIGNTEYFMNKYNQIGFYFGNDFPKPS